MYHIHLCKWCHGSGLIEVQHFMKPRLRRKPKWETCRFCNGKGYRVKEEPNE